MSIACPRNIKRSSWWRLYSACTLTSVHRLRRRSSQLFVSDVSHCKMTRSKHRPSATYRLPACPFRSCIGERCLHYAFLLGGLVSLFTHIRASYNRQQTLGRPFATSGRPFPLSLHFSLSLSLSFFLPRNLSLARLDSRSLSRSIPSSILLHLAIHVTGTVYWFLEGSACALVHAISAVKGFVHDGGDEFGGSPDGGDADEGGSGTVGERRVSRKRRRERERER